MAAAVSGRFRVSLVQMQVATRPEDNVAAALKIMMDREGISISRRRITLSTAGYVPNMARCGAELGVGLAVSLHAVNDALRDKLVPINRKFPIAELLAACRAIVLRRPAPRIQELAAHALRVAARQGPRYGLAECGTVGGYPAHRAKDGEIRQPGRKANAQASRDHRAAEARKRHADRREASDAA